MNEQQSNTTNDEAINNRKDEKPAPSPSDKAVTKVSHDIKSELKESSIVKEQQIKTSSVVDHDNSNKLTDLDISNEEKSNISNTPENILDFELSDQNTVNINENKIVTHSKNEHNNNTMHSTANLKGR